MYQVFPKYLVENPLAYVDIDLAYRVGHTIFCTPLSPGRFQVSPTQFIVPDAPETVTLIDGH